MAYKDIIYLGNELEGKEVRAPQSKAIIKEIIIPIAFILMNNAPFIFLCLNYEMFKQGPEPLIRMTSP